MFFALIAFLATLGMNGYDSGNSYFGIGAPIQEQSDSSTVNKLLKRTDFLIERGDFNLAEISIDSILTISESINYEEGIVLAKSSIVDILVIKKQPDSALSVIDEILSEYPDNKERLRLYSFQATALNMKGLSEQAIESYQKALSYLGDLSPEKQDRSRVATLVNMASAYMRVGDRAKTLENYLLGLEFAEASKDTSMLLIILNNMGDAYNTYEEYEKAESYLERALSIAREKQFKPDLLRIHLNLANVYTNLGKLMIAEEFYQRALQLNKEVRPDTPPFQIVYNLGQLYLDLEKYNKAEAAFQESLQYCLDLNIPIGLYFNYRGLGTVNEALSRNEEAIQWYTKSLEVAESLGQNPFISFLNEKLYELHKSIGNFEEALIALENYKEVSDSLSALDSENALADLESRLELRRQTGINTLLEEKQLQQERQLQFQLGLIITATLIIILILFILYSKNKDEKEKERAYNELQKQREELEKLNQEMNKLFAIIAHDLRAPLASMHGILYLLKSGDLSKEEITAYTNEIEGSVQKNIDVMEDLLSWAKKQMTGITFVKEELNIHGLIEGVVAKQEGRSKFKEITVTNEVDKKLVLKTDENALKLIMRNLLSNSLKFTNNGDSVRFTSSEKGENIQLCVIDTGIGMSRELQDKVFANRSISFSLEGTKGEKGTGFGLSLIKEFVEKLGGSITIESEEGQGTKFCIELPKD